MKPIFNFETILKPIVEEEPCGPYLFYEPIYDAIQEARREEDASLPQGVWEHQLKRADWSQTFSLCTETLEHRSKDLQVAAWGVEAAGVLHGVRGLSEGIEMIRMLCERFWTTIHPPIQEGDPEVRNAPFEWGDGAFCEKLRQTPLSEKNSTDERIFYWSDWIDAEHREQMLLQQKAAKPNEKKVRILTSIDSTPTSFYLGLNDRLGELNDSVEKLHEFLREKSGESAPTFSRLRNEIVMMRAFTKKWLAERKGVHLDALPNTKNESPMDMKAAMTGENATINHGEYPHHVHTGSFNERTEAYALLERAAEILMKCEPHSPVPYLIRRLVTWKNKSLDELMEELGRREIDWTVLRKLFAD